MGNGNEGWYWAGTNIQKVTSVACWKRSWSTVVQTIVWLQSFLNCQVWSMNCLSGYCKERLQSLTEKSEWQAGETLEKLCTLPDWQKLGFCFRFMPNLILVWFSFSFLLKTLQPLGSFDYISADSEVQEKRWFWRLGRGSVPKCVRWMLWFSLWLARLYDKCEGKKQICVTVT